MSRDGNFMKDCYIAIHQRMGYYASSEGSSSPFTQNIAKATVFTNLDEAKTLCDEYNMSAYKEVGCGIYKKVYQGKYNNVNKA